jgi:hypothetical protein
MLTTAVGEIPVLVSFLYHNEMPREANFIRKEICLAHGFEG